MHVCHLAEVEAAEVYALKTMAVVEHGVDVYDIICLQVAEVFDGCEILTPIEPVGSTCQRGAIGERIVEDHRCNFFINLRPSATVFLSSIIKRSNIHTTAFCLLVIVIERQ